MVVVVVVDGVGLALLCLVDENTISIGFLSVFSRQRKYYRRARNTVGSTRTDKYLGFSSVQLRSRFYADLLILHTKERGNGRLWTSSVLTFFETRRCELSNATHSRRRERNDIGAANEREALEETSRRLPNRCLVGWVGISLNID